MPQAACRNSSCPKYEVVGASRHDQAVVVEGHGLAELVGVDRAGVEVDALHLAQDDAQVDG